MNPAQLLSSLSHITLKLYDNKITTDASLFLQAYWEKLINLILVNYYNVLTTIGQLEIHFIEFHLIYNKKK